MALEALISAYNRLHDAHLQQRGPREPSGLLSESDHGPTSHNRLHDDAHVHRRTRSLETSDSLSESGAHIADVNINRQQNALCEPLMSDDRISVMLDAHVTRTASYSVNNCYLATPFSTEQNNQAVVCLSCDSILFTTYRARYFYCQICGNLNYTPYQLQL